MKEFFFFLSVSDNLIVSKRQKAFYKKLNLLISAVLLV
jgi:hypothetical protein